MGIRSTLLLVSLLLTACAPTIGNKQDVRTTSFMIGDTQKQEVLDVLGLPAEISKSEAVSLEYWAYKEKPEVTGIMIAIPDGFGSAYTETFSTGAKPEYEFKDAAAIYVFDSSDHLIDVRYPN